MQSPLGLHKVDTARLSNRVTPVSPYTPLGPDGHADDESVTLNTMVPFT
jgi:hypothetical protein